MPGNREGDNVLDLLQLWGLARRNWLVLLASLLAGLAIGAGVSYVQPTLYAATSTGYVVAGNSATVGDAFAGSNLAAEKAGTYLPLVQSRSVAEAVAEELEVSPGAVSLQGSTEGVIFRITATAPSADLARDMADAAIRATSIEANDLETLTVSGESSGRTVIRIVPVELAVTPSQPVSPDWTRNLIIGLALGLMAGFGLVVLRHTLDRRVRQSADVEEITQSSAMGVVPLASELVDSVSLARDRGAAAEALRQLRTNLRFVSVDNPPRSIVVTSANQSEGKSTIATHLASLLAESGQPTVLIDADLRRPVLAQHFDVDGSVGLTQVIAGSVDLADVLVPTSQDGLLLLPAGRIPPNPSEIVGSGRMESLIAGLSQSYMVIIDAPPLLPVTDSGLLAVAADGALLVVRHGKTRKEQVALAARNLAHVDGTLLGFVMNMVPKKDMGSVVYGYGYGSYSPQYYYGEDGSKKRRGEERATRRTARRARRQDGESVPPQHSGPVHHEAVDEATRFVAAEDVLPEAPASTGPTPKAPPAARVKFPPVR